MQALHRGVDVSMTTETEHIRVFPGRGGWVFVDVPGYSGRLYVKASLAKTEKSSMTRAALKVAEMVIDGEGDFIGSPFLRNLSISAIETLMNQSKTYEEILDKIDECPEHLEIAVAVSHFQSDVETTRSGMGKRPQRPRARVSARPGIKRPKNLDDEFLQRVAEFYVYAVANGERPLVAIEHEADVPRNTAARWVALARKRGFLATDPSVKESRGGK